MRRGAILVFSVALSWSCQKGGKPEGGKPEAESGNIGTSAANIAMDSAAMRDANLAAGDVIRATGDCETVKAGAPEALRKLDEIAGRIRTPGGKTSLESLRKQVTTAAEACP